MKMFLLGCVVFLLSLFCGFAIVRLSPLAGLLVLYLVCRTTSRR
jgi:hypothetical protein